MKSDKIMPWQIQWNDREVLKTQVDHCKCTLELKTFDEVEDPKDYIKAGTNFWVPTKLYPWESEFRGQPKKLN